MKFDLLVYRMELIGNQAKNLFFREDIRLKLTRVYLSQGKYQQAERLLDDMLGEYPENFELWVGKAMVSLQIRKEVDFGA